MTRQDHERTMGQAQGAKNPSLNAQSQSLMPPPASMREALHQMRGNYTHGHPGLPPRDYKQPKESRR